jgi:hypothetical protein
MHHLIEESNYRNDHRVRAQERWYDSFDESKMKATVTFYPNGERETVVVPVRFEVCPTCNGHGMHVNPSIDASGISGEDFERDPGFKQEYIGGCYDVKCYGCDGRRVVPVCCDGDVNFRLRVAAEEEAEMEAIYAAERSMGA